MGRFSFADLSVEDGFPVPTGGKTPPLQNICHKREIAGGVKFTPPALLFQVLGTSVPHLRQNLLFSISFSPQFLQKKFLFVLIIDDSCSSPGSDAS